MIKKNLTSWEDEPEQVKQVESQALQVLEIMYYPVGQVDSHVLAIES